MDSDRISVSTRRRNRLPLKPDFPARRHREYKRGQAWKVRRFFLAHLPNLIGDDGLLNLEIVLGVGVVDLCLGQIQLRL